MDHKRVDREPGSQKADPQGLGEREADSALLGLTLLVREYVTEVAKLYSSLEMILAFVVECLRTGDVKRARFQDAE
jgi:hypothetical protein